MQISNEFITGCKNREADSQRKLYDQLLPYLNALCGRYLKEKHHRKDILQEAFLTIFNKVEQFDPKKGEFASWTAKITINLCLKHNRSSKSALYDDIEESQELSSISPEAIANLSKEDLMKFLMTMPEKFYEVYNLFVIEGFSHKEIAEIAGIKPSLSRKRLARAKEWLASKPESIKAITGAYKVSKSA